MNVAEIWLKNHSENLFYSLFHEYMQTHTHILIVLWQLISFEWIGSHFRSLTPPFVWFNWHFSKWIKLHKTAACWIFHFFSSSLPFLFGCTSFFEWFPVKPTKDEAKKHFVSSLATVAFCRIPRECILAHVSDWDQSKLIVFDVALVYLPIPFNTSKRMAMNGTDWGCILFKHSGRAHMQTDQSRFSNAKSVPDR